MRMRRWLAGIVAGALVLPAAAAEDMATMNDVSRAWDRYAALSSQDNAEAADLLATSSEDHFAFLRDLALYASPGQLRRLPSLDRVLVYLLRATQAGEVLQAMDGRAVAALCFTRGWIGVEPASEDAPILALSNVTVVGDEAVGEIGSPTETQFQFGPILAREDGRWRYRYESMVMDASTLMDQSFRQAGIGDVQAMEMSISTMLESEAPALATLDRAPLDDAAIRTRLNEDWPDYMHSYRLRVQAMRQKAADGDLLAQFGVGSLLYSGAMPQLAPKDEAEGLAWLEKASEGGHAQAAWVASNAIPQRGKFSEASLARALPHLQRAAAHGREPMALLGMANYYFEGVAGLPRDCRQAADWATRAEEAGAKQARNERVWIWATCPVAGQRDPAQALELAQFMIRRKDELNWHELDTVASALAANRDFEQAVPFQLLALEKLAADTELTEDKRAGTRKRMTARLSRYRNGNDYVLDYRAIDEIRAGRM